MSEMNDPYDDQLKAARYKAELDHTRQLLAGLIKSMDDLDDENEHLRDMLNDVAWKLGIGHVVHYYSEDNYQECHKRVLDEISKLTGPTSYDVAQVTTSAYDLLPEKDRETLRWVREQGGLDVVETRWDNDTQLADAVICALWPCGIPDCGGNERIMDELSKRLMPEGMEWPRFEDGEPVHVGDEVELHTGCITVEAVEFSRGKVCIKDAEDGDWSTSSYAMHPLKRPAPKVLDADGEPIEKGETLYVACTGHGITVAETYQDDTVLDAESDQWEASELTHVKPILASDGEPLKVGQTVYHIADGKEYRVSELLKDGGAMVEAQGRPTGRCRADYLTHQRPDSWERLEEDANALAEAETNGRGIYNVANDYCNARGLGDGTVWVLMAQDLVRRCRALAERGE